MNTNEKLMEKIGVATKVYMLSYAFLKLGDKIICAWCKKRVEKWTAGEQKRHVEAHDWSDKEHRALLTSEVERVCKEVIEVKVGRFDENWIECSERLRKEQRKALSVISSDKGK